MKRTKNLAQPHHILKRFKNINSIFRYNKFVPSDFKFVNHYDTPYYDNKSQHCSKYTLVIYLTGGTGNPALKIENIELNSMDALTGVIFDQKYEHEGQSYIDHDKIFIRTELIYYDNKLDYSEEVAKIFNIGCYMVKESLFNMELKQYMNDLFNMSAKIRHHLEAKSNIKPIFLYKTWESKNISYITNGNGNDYWFPSYINLRLMAIIIILDYFGGKYTISDSYKATSQIIQDMIETDENIFQYLINKLDTIDKDSQSKIVKDVRLVQHLDESKISKRFCCTYHSLQQPDSDDDSDDNDNDFGITRCGDVVGCFNSFGDRNNNSSKFSISIFNEKLLINTDDMKILPNKIIFNSTGTMNKINFAACWGYDDDGPDKCFEKNKVPAFNLPSIYYNKCKNGYHCTIDMFNNNFIMSSQGIYLTI